MEKSNHFSNKYITKSSDELRSITNDTGYHEDAKLAAVWELERRNDSDEELQKLASRIEAENERITASKLTGERYSTFWLRFFAAIVDGFVMWPIGFLLSYVTNSEVGLLIVLGNLLNNLSPYIYSIFLHGHYGQTLGKMALGVKVVDFEHERNININQALKRDIVPIFLITILYIYSFILFSDNDGYRLETNFASLAPMFFIGFLSILWTVLEFLSMLFNEKSRAVHDLIAGTVAVRTQH